MTEDQLIAALKQLTDDAHASYRANISSQGYHRYIQAMGAVIDRYRETNPYATIPMDQIKFVSAGEYESSHD